MGGGTQVYMHGLKISNRVDLEHLILWQVAIFIGVCHSVRGGGGGSGLPSYRETQGMEVYGGADSVLSAKRSLM